MSAFRLARRGLAAGVALVCLGAVLSGCDRGQSAVVGQPGPRPKWLTIITPHNPEIQNAFQQAFSSWHTENRSGSVYFNWITRGTPECLAYVAEQAQAERDANALPTAPDLMFGGGIADHRWLKDAGYSMPVTIGDSVAGIPERVGNQRMYDEDNHWFATSLSSFGILYNDRALRQRGIAPPETWTDLADPRFAGWVGLADPARSGSTRECLLVILQDQGWEDGWKTIMQILANAPALVDRSGAARDQVESGVSLATFVVNYDGLVTAAESEGRLQYVQPDAGTLVSANAISLLKTGEPHKVEIAEDFVRFVLSEEGQKLWGFAAEHTGRDEALFHYPIMPSVYEQHADKLALRDNPLDEQVGESFDPDLRRRYARIIVPLVTAATGENHIALQQALRAARERGRVDELVAPLLDEQAAIEAGDRFADATEAQQAEMIADWAEQFRSRYDGMLN